MECAAQHRMPHAAHTHAKAEVQLRRSRCSNGSVVCGVPPHPTPPHPTPACAACAACAVQSVRRRFVQPGKRTAAVEARLAIMRTRMMMWRPSRLLLGLYTRGPMRPDRDPAGSQLPMHVRLRLRRRTTKSSTSCSRRMRRVLGTSVGWHSGHSDRVAAYPALRLHACSSAGRLSVMAKHIAQLRQVCARPVGANGYMPSTCVPTPLMASKHCVCSAWRTGVFLGESQGRSGRDIAKPPKGHHALVRCRS